MKLRIREMRKLDIPNVRQLWQTVGFTLTASDSPTEIERMIKHNPGLCLVAELENNNQISLVSAVLGGFDGRRGWIHHLAVHPDYQRKGIGEKMMQELTQRFREKNVIKLKLEVVESNNSVITFYKKLGWVVRPELVTMSFDLIKSN